MDAGTVVVLVLAAIIILAAIAIIAQALASNRKASAEAYSTRMNANAAVLSRMTARADHEITIDYDGVLTVEPREVAQYVGATTQAAQPENASVHDDAVDLVFCTMQYPAGIGKNGKQTRADNQLMSANECQERGVFGGDRTRRQNAVKYLCESFDVQAVNDKGGAENGVFYRGSNGDLTRLLTDMAVKRAPYPNQKQSTAV